MLGKIITYLNKIIKDEIKLSSVVGIVDIIVENKSDGEQKKYPALYRGKDELQHITKLDYNTGVSFWTRGRASTQKEPSKRECSDYIRYNYRPLLYIIAKRENCDSLDNMIQNLSALLKMQNSKFQREETGANIIVGYASSIETDSDIVIRDVFENVELKRHDLIFLRVEMDIMAYYYTDCLETYCE